MRPLWIVAGVAVVLAVGVSDVSCAGWAHAVVWGCGAVSGAALGALAARAIRPRLFGVAAFVAAVGAALAFAWLLVRTCGFAG